MTAWPGSEYITDAPLAYNGTEVGSKIVVTGPFTGGPFGFAVFDTATKTAQAYTGVPVEARGQMCTLDGYAYCAGMSVLYAINPSSGAVTTIPRPKIGTESYYACVTHGGRVWVTCTTNATYPQGYDPGSGSWVAGPDLVLGAGVSTPAGLGAVGSAKAYSLNASTGAIVSSVSYGSFDYDARYQGSVSTSGTIAILPRSSGAQRLVNMSTLAATYSGSFGSNTGGPYRFAVGDDGLFYGPVSRYSGYPYMGSVNPVTGAVSTWSIPTAIAAHAHYAAFNVGGNLWSPSPNR